MRSMVSVMCGLAAGTALAMTAQAAMAETNVLLGTTPVVAGTLGELRPGSGWSNLPEAPVTSLTDGVFRPNETTWNDGSVWWDEFQGGPVTITFNLGAVHQLNRFVIQADNNDYYQLQYLSGATWVNAFEAVAIPGYGLMTRDSGLVPAIQTSELRLIEPFPPVYPADQYYAVSEVQAFQVPEPATWALMLLGVTAIGAGMRMQRKAALAA